MLTFILGGCKKTKIETQPEATYVLDSNVRINDLVILGDHKWLAVGGNRNAVGKFYMTEDAGKSWTVQQTEFPRSVYCLHFLDSLRGFAGGDLLDLWKTVDGGKTWDFYWLGNQVPFHEEDRPAVRNFRMLNDSNWYFCGGENFGSGIIYQTHDAGIHWSFDFKQHEYRAMDFFPNGEGLIGGYGSALLIRDDGNVLVDSEFKNDFMTSVISLSEKESIGVSYNGAIYYSSDNGLHWTVRDQHNKLFDARVNWNDVDVAGENLIAVGNSGIVGRSTDLGNTWRFERLENEADLLSVSISNHLILISASEGRIFRLQDL